MRLRLILTKVTLLKIYFFPLPLFGKSCQWIFSKSVKPACRQLPFAHKLFCFYIGYLLETMEVNLWPKHFIANFKGMTGDKRLDARRQRLWNSLNMQPGSTISKLFTSSTELVAC